MAASLDSKEKEVIVLPGMPFGVSRERLIGPNSPLVMPPRYLGEYAKGREQISMLYKRPNKGTAGEHDMVHSAVSRYIYESSSGNCGPVTAFLTENHCLDDKRAEDVNYLRLPISHKLVPLAVAAVNEIKM